MTLLKASPTASITSWQPVESRLVFAVNSSSKMRIGRSQRGSLENLISISSATMTPPLVRARRTAFLRNYNMGRMRGLLLLACRAIALEPNP